MSARANSWLAAIWVGIGVQIGGRILDRIWHANHDEFEGASQQLEAHWLLWLGVVITVAVATVAARRLPTSERNWGYTTIIAGGALYIPVAIWHFVEHANHSDPELAHYLLALGQGVILAGAIAAVILTRRRGTLSRQAT